MGGVLAIDHGERKTGLAYTDPGRIVVRALETLPFGGSSDELLDSLEGLVRERDVAAFLVGLPISPRSDPNDPETYGERARSVYRFAEALRARFPDRCVFLYDEHLTTKEAEHRLSEAGYRGSERKRRKDSWSALCLLEDWIGAGEPG